MSHSLCMHVIQINVKRIDLNQSVVRPYIILALGDQLYQTSTSEREHGDWNEGFEFSVTYHAQLFDSLQLDLYDKSILLRDRHVGRAEIKLAHLEGLPECFTSFYEIWDRKTSVSNVSYLVGKKTLSSNIGAIQLRISYRFQRAPEPELQPPTPTVAIVPKTRMPTEMETDHDFLAQLSEAMQDVDSDNRFQRYEDPENRESNAQRNQTQFNRQFSSFDDDEVAVQYPLLDMVGSWTIAPETQKVVKAIIRLGSAFGQGLELTNTKILTAVVVLERFYRNKTSERLDTGLATLEQVEHAGYFWRFSMACYGWAGINFVGKGNGIIKDFIRWRSDHDCAIDFLRIPKEDLLAYEFHADKVFHPSYHVTLDRATNSIVLAIRGTMSAFDTLTDLVCEYQQWKGGLVHGGMKTSAEWFMANLVPQIVAYIAKHKVSALNIVGHSLGAGTASVLTMMLLDHEHELKALTNKGFRIACHAYAPACCVSKDLADRYRDHIRCYVYEDDIVSRLSYGSMMDVRTMLVGAVDAAAHMGLTKVFLTGTDEDWEPTLKAVEAVRQQIINSAVKQPKLYIAGSVFQLWRHEDDQDRVEMKPASNRLCEEILVKPAALSQHLLGILDNAFPRARESSMMVPSNRSRPTSPATLSRESSIVLSDTRDAAEEHKLLDQQINRSITLGVPENYSPLPYPPPSRRVGLQRAASFDMSDDEDEMDGSTLQAHTHAQSTTTTTTATTTATTAPLPPGIVPGVPVYQLRSPIQPKEFLQGVVLALEGCYVALTNPDFRHGRLYKTMLRLLLFTLVAHGVTQIVFFLPMLVMGNMLRFFGFMTDRDTSEARQGLSMFSSKVQELMSAIPLLGLLFLRYLYPQPLDEIFMEALAHSDRQMEQEHQRLKLQQQREQQQQQSWQAPPASSAHDHSNNAQALVMDRRGPFAPALAAYPYKVRYWHEMGRYVKRTWKRVKWGLLFLVVSWLPIVGPLAFPIASFLSTLQAIGSKPLAVVFALMSLLVPRGVSVYILKGFFACRALTRELMDPYFLRLGMTHFQKRKWFNYRKSVLLGFGVVFYIACSIPVIGVAIFGLAQASSAYVLQTLADPPPPPVPIDKTSRRSSSSSSLASQNKSR
ncbi:hypothetical protein DFQ27_001861 [Actinomortierella ambigua]|uniref:C2 domain-containing protein n=1 Tax=Actinomortierella ambigua TaxID=1343610 RepID=A0A9P6U7P8_9FUNG|nr:hypothetical protein DFQ27_001861 [Actinomortierella ambigua]